MPRSFLRVWKQADEQRHITRRATLELAPHFQEDRPLSFLKDYVRKPDDPLKRFAGVLSLVQIRPGS